jgi:hypothetical protein
VPTGHGCRRGACRPSLSVSCAPCRADVHCSSALACRLAPECWVVCPAAAAAVRTQSIQPFPTVMCVCGLCYVTVTVIVDRMGNTAAHQVPAKE